MKRGLTCKLSRRQKAQLFDGRLERNVRRENEANNVIGMDVRLAEAQEKEKSENAGKTKKKDNLQRPAIGAKDRIVKPRKPTEKDEAKQRILGK